MIQDRLVIVSTNSINAKTENQSVSRTDKNTLIIKLDHDFNDLGKRVIESIPDSVKSVVTTTIICSSNDDSYTRAKCFNDEKLRPRDVLSVLSITLNSIINQFLPNVNKIFKLDAHCASGLFATEIAACHPNEVTLILGIDKSTSPHFLNLFRQIGAVAESCDQYYVPFDQRRCGFVMSEAAAALVVTGEKNAQKLGLDIVAIVDNISTKTIYTHPTSPSDPVLLEEFINGCIVNSHKKTKDIAWWDAHATATPVGDEIEYQIFANIFKNQDTIISSFKSRVGHCMSASSLVEIDNSIRSLKAGIISENTGLESSYCMTQDSRISTVPISTDRKTFVKTGFGFGGRNGVAIITVV
jgi:3-oxoacyl-(acyl-carrier-protein) synthase